MSQVASALCPTGDCSSLPGCSSSVCSAVVALCPRPSRIYPLSLLSHAPVRSGWTCILSASVRPDSPPPPMQKHVTEDMSCLAFPRRWILVGSHSSASRLGTHWSGFASWRGHPGKHADKKATLLVLQAHSRLDTIRVKRN